MKQANNRRFASVIFLILTAVFIVSCAGLELSQMNPSIGNGTRLKNGTLSLDNINIDFGDINVPESADTALTDVSDTVQAEGLLSRVYRLDLGFSCNEPISVKFDITDTAKEILDNGETLLFGVGVETPDGGSILYKYIEPLISDGVAAAVFIPAEILDNTTVRGLSSPGKDAAAKPVDEKLYLGLFGYSFVDLANGHFRVYMPLAMWTGGSFLLDYNEREALLEDLEGVYQQYLSKGYQYNNRTEYPIDVHIQSLDVEGYYTEGKKGTAGGQFYANTSNYGCIYLNIDLFKNGYSERQRVKEILAHEFFHFVQYNYATPKTGNPWLDEATATYFEYKERGAFPDTTIKYWSLIYDGVFPGENTLQDGYARMPLIDYLTQKFGEDFILKAYQFGGANGDWENALHVALQGPPDPWVNDFYQQYFTGETTSFYKPFIFYQELTGGQQKEFTHAGQALELAVPDEEYIFACLENDDVAELGSTTLSIPALGARVVALDIETDTLDNLPDGMDPVIHVEGNVALTVYAIKGNNYEKLEGNNNVKLTDFVKANEEKVKYIALVVGLQNDEKADVEFSVQLLPSVLIASIKLAEEDTRGTVRTGYSAALAALGDIPVDSEGNFNATLAFAQAQFEDISSQCGFEETVTWNIEVTNFEINGTWDPFTQAAKGTISCFIEYSFEEICPSSWGNEIDEITVGTTWEVDSTATFDMEIKDNYLVAKIYTELPEDGTEEYDPLILEFDTYNQGPANPLVEVKFSYTTP